MLIGGLPLLQQVLLLLLTTPDDTISRMRGVPVVFRANAQHIDQHLSRIRLADTVVCGAFVMATGVAISVHYLERISSLVGFSIWHHIILSRPNNFRRRIARCAAFHPYRCTLVYVELVGRRYVVDLRWD
uniref:Putative secreted protein n=1 Tax=Anopheles darlingi TaxID=43151 RepID=A0A2M4DDY2_ANODA